MSKALEDIAAERRRQIEVEGWTPEHDDQHDAGEMMDAAYCYLGRRREERMFTVFGSNHHQNKAGPHRAPGGSFAYIRTTERACLASGVPPRTKEGGGVT